MKSHRFKNQAEERLTAEIITECLDGDGGPLKTQYNVNFRHQEHGFRSARLDLAIPELKIAIRVMGGVHGMPWAPSAKDEIQKELLYISGWDVIDIWHTDRLDLWI